MAPNAETFYKAWSWTSTCYKLYNSDMTRMTAYNHFSLSKLNGDRTFTLTEPVGQGYQVFLGPISQNLSEVDWGVGPVGYGSHNPEISVNPYAWKVAANVTLENNRLLILPFTSLPDACHNGGTIYSFWDAHGRQRQRVTHFLGLFSWLGTG